MSDHKFHELKAISQIMQVTANPLTQAQAEELYWAWQRLTGETVTEEFFK